MHHLLVTHSYKKNLVALGLTLLCLPITSYAQIRSELTRSSFETTLSNGLQVIIREDHRSPMVMTQIWYKVGSTDESGNTTGISHVLEHMMFKGRIQSLESYLWWQCQCGHIYQLHQLLSALSKNILPDGFRARSRPHEQSSATPTRL